MIIYSEAHSTISFFNFSGEKPWTPFFRGAASIMSRCVGLWLRQNLPDMPRFAPLAYHFLKNSGEVPKPPFFPRRFTPTITPRCNGLWLRQNMPRFVPFASLCFNFPGEDRCNPFIPRAFSALNYTSLCSANVALDFFHFSKVALLKKHLVTPDLDLEI